MSNIDIIKYSLGVSCIVVQNSEIVFEKRANNRDGAGLIDFCSGHIETGEAPRFTMRRELREELGVPYKYSTELIQIGQHQMYLAKRQKEKYWDVIFFYVEIPPHVILRPQNTEVLELIRAPFQDGIKMIKNDDTQYPHDQMAITIDRVEILYHNWRA